ncbi:MAG: type I glyceraldehyde-3-phosphate dehydrogenase [Candidatus Midichloria sp.]|nr:type I glyceraldehyde-3-phosphate dehydrogenase [Candidatus Midichloria sp.]
MKKLRLGINGFGRIGKCILAAYFESFKYYFNEIDIVAVNAGTPNIADRIHSLKYDSVHGRFKAEIKISDEETFLVDNQHRIKMIFERNIENLDWLALGVDVVLECTGSFNKDKKAHAHLKSGAKKVIVSAPYDSADATIVMGANETALDPFTHKVISIGSCTTNCLAPIAKILNNELSIESGFVTTIHAATNDQLILDGRHTDRRRARAAFLSAIPASTGAAKSIGVVLPELQDRLGGAAIRIPTANVSMIDLKFLSAKNTSKDEINSLMKQAISQSPTILAISDEELVSCDFNHTKYSAIFDTTLTSVVNRNFCRVVAWYDNEWGFSSRMLDVAKIFNI